MIDEERLAEKAAERDQRRAAAEQRKRGKLDRLNAARSLVETFESDGAQCLRITTNRTKALIASGGAVFRLALIAGASVIAVVYTPVAWIAVSSLLALHLWFGLKPSAVLASKGEYYSLRLGPVTLGEGTKPDVRVILYEGTLLSEGETWRGCCKVCKNGMPRFAAAGMSPNDFAQVAAFCRRNGIHCKDEPYEGTVSHG